ncbi:MAG: cytoskeletal protein CcmA (bactofilin family) [Sphingobacteriales bacterium]|jgi:cytoskeletal protein CcmA (bactofilin family)
MFTKENGNAKEAAPSNSINLIATGTRIKGDMFSEGDIRVDGTIEGNIDSKAKIVIGNKGKVNGELLGRNADISGTITGTIKISEVLFLKSTANISGDISTNKLIVESGARFNGACSMGNSSEISENGQSRPQGKTEKVTS